MMAVLLAMSQTAWGQLHQDTLRTDFSGEDLTEESLANTLYSSDLFDNVFYGIQIGVNTMWSNRHDEGGASSWFRPRHALSLSLGKWLSPVVGLRALTSYQHSSSFISQVDEGYSWHSAGFGLDGMLSLTNLLQRYDEKRRFNMVAFIGIGGIMTFGFSHPAWNADDAWFRSKGRSMLDYHLGLMGLWRMSEKWDFSVELSHNVFHDSFDGHVTDGRWDRRFTFYVGVQRRLHNRDRSYQFRYVYYDPSKFEPVNGEINRLRQQEVEAMKRPPLVKDVNSHQVIVLVSFKKGSMAIDRMQEVNIYTIVQAYRRFSQPPVVCLTPLDDDADNADLFQSRAAVVRNALVSQYDIPSEHIVIESDRAKVEQKDKTDNAVIVYLNQSKNDNR